MRYLFKQANKHAGIFTAISHILKKRKKKIGSPTQPMNDDGVGFSMVTSEAMDVRLPPNQEIKFQTVNRIGGY
jgi:hypothetical protein